MLHGLRTFVKGIRPEDPRRIRAFRSAIENLKWDEEHVLGSQSILFNAVDDLAQAEVKYYYRRRGTRAWISGVSRCFAWLFGTTGLILPLLAGTGNPTLREMGNYGYGFLVTAASCLAANSLFGGTDGHIRFVTTQLELERLIIASRVKWCKYMTGPQVTREQHLQGFALIHDYAGSIHKTTISETDHWGEALLAALAKFQKSIDSNTSPTEKKV